MYMYEEGAKKTPQYYLLEVEPLVVHASPIM